MIVINVRYDTCTHHLKQNAKQKHSLVLPFLEFSSWNCGSLRVVAAAWSSCHLLLPPDCFPLFLHFPTSMIKPILWLKFFCRQKAGWGCWGWGGARIIRFCSISVSLRTRALKSECLAGLCYLLARWLWEISQPFEPQLSMNGNGGKEALTSQISLRIKWDCVCQNT